MPQYGIPLSYLCLAIMAATHCSPQTGIREPQDLIAEKIRVLEEIWGKKRNFIPGKLSADKECKSRINNIFKMSTLELKSIAELQDLAFFIPDYQRGYRWTRQQVEDLLNDILEFSQKENAGIYCLQPLVVVRKSSDEQLLDKIRQADDLSEVKRLLNGQWEVVDGQQRLTTIRLILEVLQHPRFYDIKYATREKSAEFLNKIARQDTTQENEDNIDYHHISQAVIVIREWMEKKNTEKFLSVLLKQVKFIWYETQEENPKEVFTRLNIGKISLTNAELVKALLLNKSNFDSADDNKIRLWQQEISMKWDVMEYALQSSEFWLFLNKPNSERPTRIDFIFDMICHSDLLQCKNNNEKEAADDYKTFRYFYHYLTVQKQQGIPMAQATHTIWEKAQEIFQTLQEWFDDKELYHYIGFLICMGKSVDEIYSQWTRYTAKSDFNKTYLMPEIKNSLRGTDIENTYYEVNTDDKQKHNGGSKTNCRPILLLHNLQTVINQNNVLTGNKKYDDGVFYKFPFHLYKSEGWDVEHIDSNTENKLNNIQAQCEWLLNAYFGLQDKAYQELRKQIQDFFSQYTGKVYEQSDVPDKQAKRNKQFESLRNEIDAINSSMRLSQSEKNRIWNFTLLDSSTNRSYGNAIFPAKRRVIIGKDQGRKFASPTTDEQGQIMDSKPEKASSSFIPPCTKYVFLKYYNTVSFDPITWNRDDAKAYEDNIKEVLKDFLS